MIIRMFTLIPIILVLLSCSTTKKDSLKHELSEEQKKYWYRGEAEISSYRLEQARYGELREGIAVTVFVTEPFSKKKFVKADNPTKEDISVLKLNMMKKFTTGIYPYSMMNSTFFPFEEGQHALKISSSSQEWCGHTYMELLNKNRFEISVDSYFEGETDDIKLDKNYLEDDIWSWIRLKPSSLPEGTHKMIPSFFYLRLGHVDTKAYKAKLSRSSVNDSTDVYTVEYPELERTLSIRFSTKFPYRIQSWEETYYSGWGDNRKKLTTKATLMKTIMSDYWNKNGTKDGHLRKELGLD